jgi:hypothetical protein
LLSISCQDYIFFCDQNLNIIEAITQARESFHGELFFETFTIAAWGIWKERNNQIFKNIRPSRGGWKGRVTADYW